MARPLWTGSLSFGLVNVPVGLHSAVRDVDFHFRQLHEPDGALIEVKRVCSEEGTEVPYEEIARGYELEHGVQVILSDEELEAVQPRRTRTIEIEQFVEEAEVDPVYYDHPYFLLPASDDDGATRAYQLLAKVMERTDEAALGRFVMRAKEYLALVRARNGVLSLTTMLFADEVRDHDGVETASQKSHKPSARQLGAALAVIEELSGKWDPDEHHDRYRQRLAQVVARKRKGHVVKAPRQRDEAAEVLDLMDALERTLAELNGGGAKAPARKPRQKAKR